ncbi:exodeoxyribonuclease V subunit beta [Desulfobacter curvatus]|uniref:exodeoxyribonuclease V subunit beta n=1 Tax=Desulfobacter curvatus TaxID=2290 RepID=UPI0003815B7B|nr:exodeoxyribonuclease V subunit beta [Desulfobacter curvatus]
MNRPAVPLPLDPFALDLEKISLIEASAGTGKTYTITTLFVRLVAMGYKVESILVVTFTEAAAAELKLRIRKRLVHCLMVLSGQENDEYTPDDLTGFLGRQKDADHIRQLLRLAVTCFDQAAIMTIHSFCFSVLRENAFESNAHFDIELMVDNRGFVDQVVRDFFSGRINHLDPLFLSFLDRNNITPDTFGKGLVQAASRPEIKVVPEPQVFQEEQLQEICNKYNDTVKLAGEILNRELECIRELIQTHAGIDKRSYNKKNLSNWLGASQKKFETSCGATLLFDMSEKGDALYKFTRTRLSEKTKAGHTPPTHDFFDLCDHLLDLSRSIAENLIALKYLFLDDYADALAAMKQGQGACFFDDLINDLAAALDGPGGHALKTAVRKRFHACLIDEFQDTDPGQYKIFSILFSDPGTPFFMIGDPKQAIYGFRGGDIFTYMTASRACDQSFTLAKNYRSAPAMVQAVNTIFSSTDNPFGFKLIPFLPVGTPETAIDRLVCNDIPVPPATFLVVDTQGLPGNKNGVINKTDARDLILEIFAKDMLSILKNPDVCLRDKDASADNGAATPVTPGDMAVLVRTNSQAEAVQKALVKRGIPCFLSKTGSVFDSIQARELYDILCAVARPGDMGLIKAALVSSVYLADEAFLKIMNTDDTLAGTWQDRFAGYRRIWEEKGFVAMISALLYQEDALPCPCAHMDERGLTNVFHLKELLAQAAMNLGKETPSRIATLIEWFRKQLFEQTRQATADELRLESDARAVAIVTIHKSKGLEYPIVFLPFLWHAGTVKDSGSPVLFHDPEENHALVLDLGSDDRERAVQLNRDEAAAEDMRLLYVALTRASAGVRIYWGGFAGIEGSALGRLLQPGGLGKDQSLSTDLEPLNKKLDQSIDVVIIEPDALPDGVFDNQTVRDTGFSPRSMTRKISPVWRVSSYSALAAGQSHDPVQDGQKERQEPNPDLFLTDAAPAMDIVPLSTFPKGPGAGDFFHKVFEEIDFCNPATIEPSVAGNLDRFGFAMPKAVPDICDAFKGVLSAPLDTGQGRCFSLDQITLNHRLVEMEFNITLDRFSLPALGKLFEQFETVEENQKIAGYGARVSSMRVSGFKGFLKGFIDLVVCHEDQWYILDYKSNYLGPCFSDYNPAAVTAAMISHDYILQYTLYLAALDRYLQLRLEDYNYKDHFGGVFYLFIRGMAKDKNTGIYFHRPGNEFMKRLRTLLS